MKVFETYDVRPYRLMCLICRMGRQTDEPYCFEQRLDEILEKMRTDKLVPLRLRCNVTGTYRYQNPGRKEDTPEGEMFNDRRDLVIMQKMGIVPGYTLPAIDMMQKLHRSIRNTTDVCGFEQTTSGEWKGCSLAGSGNYERGRDRLEEIIVPRAKDDIEEHRRNSIDGIYKAEELRIRPHHLMCMSCFHAGRSADDLKHIDADNLYEVVDMIQKNPDKPIRLIQGPCMVCPSCAAYDPETNLCVGGISMSLRDEKKDLDVLQMLGLKYGDVLPARDLYKRLYEKVESTVQVCGQKDGVERGPEWRICGGSDGNQGYVKARAMNLGIE